MNCGHTAEEHAACIRELMNKHVSEAERNQLESLAETMTVGMLIIEGVIEHGAWQA